MDIAMSFNHVGNAPCDVSATTSRLNELGYAQLNSNLQLDLVYNPTGLGLPPEQQKLEASYKSELDARYGIQFNDLLTITNMLVSRFLDDLLRRDQYEEYLGKLHQSFNPSTIDNLMCRSLLSVDWNGFIYDCDFNQMLDLLWMHGRLWIKLRWQLDQLTPGLQVCPGSSNLGECGTPGDDRDA